MNPDHALLLRFENGAAQPMHSNPLARALDAQLLTLDRVEGRISMGFLAGGDFCGTDAPLHLGATATMLDFALGFAGLARLTPPQRIATTALNLNCPAPCRPGRYVVEAWITQHNDALFFCSGHMLDQDGRVCATGSAVLALLNQ